MTRVAISILNFNGIEATISCVQSLLIACQSKNPGCHVEIYVADNGSSGDEPQKLQRAFSDIANVHVQLNVENIGFSAGHNKNLRIIFEDSDPDYVWLLNNDSLVAEDAIAALLKSAQQHPDVGIWGATLLESDGETIQCAGGCFYNDWLSSYRQYGKGKQKTQCSELAKVNYDYIAGASVFFRAATLLEGLRPVPASDTTQSGQWLNEAFFLYFEELDIAKRLLPGFKMDWCRDALVTHEGGKHRRNTWSDYHATLSALKFTRMYYPQRLWFTTPARYLSKCIQLFASGKFALFTPLTQAYRDFFRGM